MSPVTQLEENPFLDSVYSDSPFHQLTPDLKLKSQIADIT